MLAPVAHVKRRILSIQPYYRGRDLRKATSIYGPCHGNPGPTSQCFNGTS